MLAPVLGVLLGFAGNVRAADTKASKTVTSKTIKDIRFWSVGDVTRVAIEVTGDFSYKVGKLSNPDRVFYEIADTAPGMVEKGIRTIEVNDGLVKTVRIGENRPGVTRVVLDLEDGVVTTESQLSNPARLMVELRSTKPLPPRQSRTGTAGPGASNDAPPAAKSEPEAAAPPTSTPSQKPPAPAQAAPSEPPPTRAVVASVPRGKPVLIPRSEKSEPKPELKSEPKAEPKGGPKSEPKPEAKTSDPKPLAEPRAAARNSNGDRSLTRVLGLKVGRVVIDAGHGGYDPGTHGKSGLVEKDITLDIAKRLAHILQDRTESEVILTRTDDTYVPLEQRYKIANDAKADLFLSIHINSSPYKNVAGIETYFLNFSASREDLDLATRENASAQTTIGEQKEMLEKIMLRANLDESRELAVHLHRSLHGMASKQNSEAKDRGLKRAPFIVLIGAEMPSVLAEVGFITNSRDEELLKTPDHRERIAEALFDGLESYVNTLSTVAQRQ